MSTFPPTSYQLEVFMQGRKRGEEDYRVEVEKEIVWWKVVSTWHVQAKTPAW